MMIVIPALGGKSITFYLIHLAWTKFSAGFPRTARGITASIKCAAICSLTLAIVLGAWLGSVYLKGEGINMGALWNEQPLHVEDTESYQSCVANIDAHAAERTRSMAGLRQLLLPGASQQQRKEIEAFPKVTPISRDAEVQSCRRRAIAAW